MLDTIGSTDRGRPWSAQTSLGQVETWRALRHPALVLGALVGAFLSLGPWLDGVPPTQKWVNETYDGLWLSWTPLYLGAFITANLIANRERADTTSEMFRGAPLDYAGRTRAVLLAVAAPAGLAVLLAAAQRQLIAGAGGFTAGSAPNVMTLVPTWPETLTPAIVTICAFTAGVAFARTTRSRSVAMVVGALFTFTFFVMYWVWWQFPFFVVVPTPLPYSYTDLGSLLEPHETDLWSITAFDSSTTTWYGISNGLSLPAAGHLIYLLGVALLMAAWALRRSGASSTRLALTGFVVTAIGLVAQVAVHYR